MLEDDGSYIDTLRLVIETDPHLLFVAGFRDPIRFLGALEDLEIDVLLLDVNLPKMKGMECIEEFKTMMPNARVIMLTVEGSRETVLNAFTQGADGYLLKDSSPDQVSAAIQEVVKDGAPMSPSIARLVVGILKTTDSREDVMAPSDLVVLLSQREREVLEHLAEGYRYAEIADRLSVATTTIKTHVKSIYRKLEVRNSAEAIKRLNNRP